MEEVRARDDNLFVTRFDAVWGSIEKTENGGEVVQKLDFIQRDGL